VPGLPPLCRTQDVIFGDTIGGSAGAWHGPLRLTMPRGSVLRVAGASAGPACKHATVSPDRRRVSLSECRHSLVAPP
jgi:hypothetical protein